ncbi:MAG: hypothetical protein MJ139_05920, partial [Limosilactobacillus sp.]|nr:hypothetical protein [Limosilactobacillus sp.]
MHENKQNLSTLIGALIATLGIAMISGVSDIRWLSVLIVVSLVSCYSVISKYWCIKRGVNRWQAGWSLVFALVFSLALVLGHNLNTTNSMNLMQLRTYFKWILLIPISFVGTTLIIQLLNQWHWQTNYPTRIGQLSPWLIYW